MAYDRPSFLKTCLTTSAILIGLDMVLNTLQSKVDKASFLSDLETQNIYLTPDELEDLIKLPSEERPKYLQDKIQKPKKPNWDDFKSL